MTDNNYKLIINFLNKLCEELSDEDFIFDRSEEIIFKHNNKPLYKSEFLCIISSIRIKDFLNKLGENNETNSIQRNDV